MMQGKIIQIIPADGWGALFRTGDGRHKWFRLVCWALTDHDEIVGMDADYFGTITGVKDGNFVRYHHESDPFPTTLED